MQQKICPSAWILVTYTEDQDEVSRPRVLPPSNKTQTRVKPPAVKFIVHTNMKRRDDEPRQAFCSYVLSVPASTDDRSVS